MSLKLDLIPSQNTHTMLTQGVGERDSMLAEFVVKKTTCVLLQKLYELELIELEKESKTLKKARKNFDEFHVGKAAGIVGQGVGWGLLGWLGGPILGFFSWYASTAVIGNIAESDWESRNRKASQDLVLAVANIGLERIKRLDKKIDQIRKEVASLKKRNDEIVKLTGSQHSFFKPTTWFSKTNLNLDSEEFDNLTKEASLNNLNVKHLIEADNYFNKWKDYYSQHFTKDNLHNRKITIGHWEFKLTYYSTPRVDNGKWVRNNPPGMTYMGTRS